MALTKGELLQQKAQKHMNSGHSTIPMISMIMMVMFHMYRCAREEFEEKDLEDSFQAMCEDIMRERKRVGHHK